MSLKDQPAGVGGRGVRTVDKVENCAYRMMDFTSDLFLTSHEPGLDPVSFLHAFMPHPPTHP